MKQIKYQNLYNASSGSSLIRKIIRSLCALTLSFALLPTMVFAETAEELAAAAETISSQTADEAATYQTSEMTDAEISAAIASTPSDPTVDESEEGESYVAGEVLVTFKESVDSKEATDTLKENVTVKTKEEAAPQTVLDNDTAVVKTEEEASVSQAVEELSQDNRVEHVQPNYLYELIEPVEEAEYENTEEETLDSSASLSTTSLNDPYRVSQWILGDSNANLYQTWDYIRTNKQVTVAVLDSGIDSDHPDLVNNIVAPTSTVSSSLEPKTYSSYEDIQGHGTHVAGIIAAEANNSIGVAGVSYNAQIMPVRVFHKSGESVSASTSDIASGIEYVIEQQSAYNVCAINMSLSFKDTSSSKHISDEKILNAAIDEAYDAGILCVCASGNYSNSTSLTDVCYPACYEKCIAVGSITSSHKRSSFSNGGEDLDVVAPGSSIYSTYWNGGYKSDNGTSMAAPYVSATVALCSTANPSATPAQIANALTSTATDLGESGKDNEYGYGQVNPLGASYGNLSYASLSSIPNQTYAGNAITPEPTVTLNGKTLVKDTDYTLSYENNTDAGTATVYVTGTGIYRGTTSTTFNIAPVSLSDATISNLSNQAYTGNTITPNPTVTLNGKTLVKDTDYTLSYKNNTNVGSATVNISGIGNYTDTITSSFTIVQAANAINLSCANIAYGENPAPSASATFKTDGEPTFTYSNSQYGTYGEWNTNNPIGTYYVKAKVAGTANYTAAEQICSFKVTQQSISGASVSSVSDQTYSGKAITPEPTVTLNGKTLVKDTDYTLSYENNVNIGTAIITITGKGNYTGSTTTTFNIKEQIITLSTDAHIQDIGWLGYQNSGAVIGTFGRALRMESIKVRISDASGNKVSNNAVSIRAHVQDIGWMNTVGNDEIAGTTGQSKRIEAMTLSLSEAYTDQGYKLYYRVHAQDIGWMGWAHDGAQAGTAGLSYRLEAIQIVLVAPGEEIPSNTYGGITSVESHPFIDAGSNQLWTNQALSYSAITHVENIGNTSVTTKGTETLGTTGRSLRVEAITLKSSQDGISFRYRTHIQDIGWQDWRSDGQLSGTQGQAKRLEAIQIELTGSNADNYDVYYRTHIQNIGWTGWTKNGAQCGSAGYAYRMECMQIVVVPKDAPAPGVLGTAFYQA